MSALSHDSINLNKLKFPKDHLYDRESEQQTLRDVYRRLVSKKNFDDVSDDQSTENKKEVVMVEGISGVGKSALAGTLRTLVEKRGKNDGYFLSGKFDLHQRSIPYAAIIEALSGLPELMRGEDTKRVQATLGDEVSKVIFRCIPALKDVLLDRASSLSKDGSQIIQERRQSRVSFGSEFRNKFNYAFQTFFRSICDQSNKHLVLFMDDLQWADAASLELLEMLIKDEGIRNLLVIGAYRSNEVDEAHPLSARIREIERSGTKVNRLVVGNLSLDAMKNMVADTLNMSVEETSPLAKVLQSKTHGNAYFSIQLLESLVADELLTFNFGTFKWTWDLGNISSVYVTNNVADLMLAKLRKIPHEEQTILAVSSCLGSMFDLPVLILVVTFLLETVEDSGTSQYVKEALSFIKISADAVKSCVDKNLGEGLLGVASFIQGESIIRFSHDQIKQAAHSLLPEGSQGILQWHVGKALVNKLTYDELSLVLFSAVDLLNSGRDVVLSQRLDSSEQKELVDLAQLNLGAGRKAMEISAFRQSVTYLERALQYIQDACGDVDEAWVKHPSFCLDANQSLADSLSCIGDMDKASKIVDMILSHSTVSKEGRMRAYATLVDAYGAQDQVQKSFDSGFSALRDYGEKRFPQNAGKANVVVELLRTKSLLKRYPVESLRQLPQLKDEARVILMEILVRLVMHALTDFPMYMPLLAFRLVKWSCAYGICSSSPAGFAVYGSVLSHLGDLNGGYKYASLAMDLLEPGAGYSFTTLVASVAKYNKEPIVNSLRGDMVGYQIGMEQGEHFHALLNLAHMLVTSFNTGRALFVVDADMKIYMPHLAEQGHTYFYKRIQPCWQAVLLLSQPDVYNSSDCKLNEKVMNEDAFLIQNKNEPGVAILVHIYSFFTAYMLGNYELAAELRHKSREYPTKYGAGLFMALRWWLFDGLTSVAMLQKGQFGNRKWKKRISNVIKKFTKLKKRGNCNLTHMLQLLEAEKYALRKNADFSIVRSKYDEAISSAAKSGFSQDRAMATERAGIFFLAHNDSYWASVYLQRAYSCWTEYGALTKAKLLENRYPQYITAEDKRLSERALNGAKKRHSRNHRKRGALFKDASESWTSIRTTSLANSTSRLSESFVREA